MMKKLLILFILITSSSLFLISPITIKNVEAYILSGTECDIADPDFYDCQGACEGSVGSAIGDDLCHEIVGTCIEDTITETPIADVCDCNCADPPFIIECIYNTSYDPRYCTPDDDGEVNCKAATCVDAESPICDPGLNGADCWLPDGPCDPDNPNHDQTFCIDDGTHGDEEAGDDIGVCLCSADDFFDASGDELCSVNGEVGIDTAIGCIPIETPEKFTEYILYKSGNIVGGMALILIVVSGYMITTSAGNPRQIQAGKELLIAAISGLILILTGILVLKIIGVNILNIPEFG